MCPIVGRRVEAISGGDCRSKPLAPWEIDLGGAAHASMMEGEPPFHGR